MCLLARKMGVVSITPTPSPPYSWICPCRLHGRRVGRGSGGRGREGRRVGDSLVPMHDLHVIAWLSDSKSLPLVCACHMTLGSYHSEK